jgi:hypothetical protein
MHRFQDEFPTGQTEEEVVGVFVRTSSLEMHISGLLGLFPCRKLVTWVPNLLSRCFIGIWRLIFASTSWMPSSLDFGGRLGRQNHERVSLCKLKSASLHC